MYCISPETSSALVFHFDFVIFITRVNMKTPKYYQLQPFQIIWINNNNKLCIKVVHQMIRAMSRCPPAHRLLPQAEQSHCSQSSLPQIRASFNWEKLQLRKASLRKFHSLYESDFSRVINFWCWDDHSIRAALFSSPVLPWLVSHMALTDPWQPQGMEMPCVWPILIKSVMFINHTRHSQYKSYKVWGEVLINDTVHHVKLEYSHTAASEFILIHSLHKESLFLILYWFIWATSPKSRRAALLFGQKMR